MSEALIIEEIKNGNKKELADVYKAYRTEFVSWATRHYQCSPEEARDIYQASIITFYDNIVKEKLQQLNVTLKTYLFAIGKNKILELRRSDKKFMAESVGNELDVEDIKDGEAERKELHLQIIQRCLEKLGDPCRTMLELYYFHGTGLQELAEKLRYKNSDTVKNLKSRCLLRLRDLVTNELKNHKS
jgi:RNA polymerase sigma factor (sigma-70 family)